MSGRVHPYVVHFAAALLLTAVAMFLPATLFRRHAWAATLLDAARWNLWLGAACALASIGTGFPDYISARYGLPNISWTRNSHALRSAGDSRWARNAALGERGAYSSDREH